MQLFEEMNYAMILGNSGDGSGYRVLDKLQTHVRSDYCKLRKRELQ